MREIVPSSDVRLFLLLTLLLEKRHIFFFQIGEFRL
jgi:hypothetical protein